MNNISLDLLKIKISQEYKEDIEKWQILKK